MGDKNTSEVLDKERDKEKQKKEEKTNKKANRKMEIVRSKKPKLSKMRISKNWKKKSPHYETK